LVSVFVAFEDAGAVLVLAVGAVGELAFEVGVEFMGKYEDNER